MNMRDTKTCGCGRSVTIHGFLRLRKTGTGSSQTEYTDDAGKRRHLIHRQCRCDSTLVVDMPLDCTAADCLKPVRHGGLCSGHAARLARGSANAMALGVRQKGGGLAGFHALTSPEPMSGCWLWTGAMRSTGYGRFSHKGAGGYAHRASLLLHTGPPPSNAPCALHSCDNRACVNPAHLRWGTKADNSRDCVRRGRNHVPGLSRDKHPRALWSDEAVEKCQRLVLDGVPRSDAALATGITLASVNYWCQPKNLKRTGAVAR